MSATQYLEFAGISAGIDLALAMAARFATRSLSRPRASSCCTTAAARPVAILLAAELKAPAGRFGPLLPGRGSISEAPLTVEDLAEQAGMSSRHFAGPSLPRLAPRRRSGERLRIEVARQRVQSSSEAIERVAQSTGFRDPERMRRAFIRAFGQPPQSLRRAARAG